MTNTLKQELEAMKKNMVKAEREKASDTALKTSYESPQGRLKLPALSVYLKLRFPGFMSKAP